MNAEVSPAVLPPVADSVIHLLRDAARETPDLPALSFEGARLNYAQYAGLAGALMISAIYDVAATAPSAFHAAYFGEDQSNYAQYSTIEGLIATDIPLLFSVSEFDVADFRRQAAMLVAAYGKARGDFPRLHWLAGHNHLSPVLAIGSPGETLGPHIRAFVEATVR